MLGGGPLGREARAAQRLDVEGAVEARVLAVAREVALRGESIDASAICPSLSPSPPPGICRRRRPRRARRLRTDQDRGTRHTCDFPPLTRSSLAVHSSSRHSLPSKRLVTRTQTAALRTAGRESSSSSSSSSRRERNEPGKTPATWEGRRRDAVSLHRHRATRTGRAGPARAGQDKGMDATQHTSGRRTAHARPSPSSPSSARLGSAAATP